jgi:hypothetical protein
VPEPAVLAARVVDAIWRSDVQPGGGWIELGRRPLAGAVTCGTIPLRPERIETASGDC